MRAFFVSVAVCIFVLATVLPTSALTQEELLQRRLEKMRQAEPEMRAAEQEQQEQEAKAGKSSPPPDTGTAPENVAIPDPLHRSGSNPDPGKKVWDTRTATTTPPAASSQAATPPVVAPAAPQPAPAPAAPVPPPPAAAKRDTQTAAKYAALAAKASKAGRFSAAVGYLDKAIAADPGDPELLNNRGNALANAGKLRESLADYDKAIAMKTSDSSFFTNRGYAYERLGNQEKTCADYKRACDLGDCGFFQSYKADGHCQ